MTKPDLCSPPVNRKGFESWLKTIICSAWAIGELGHQVRTKEEMAFVLRRIAELEGGADA